ncbi:hypothetical protein P9112_010412 [Eukaryota sp. TZLM1-RC]
MEQLPLSELIATLTELENEFKQLVHERQEHLNSLIGPKQRFHKILKSPCVKPDLPPSPPVTVTKVFSPKVTPYLDLSSSTESVLSDIDNLLHSSPHHQSPRLDSSSPSSTPSTSSNPSPLRPLPPPPRIDGDTSSDQPITSPPKVIASPSPSIPAKSVKRSVSFAQPLITSRHHYDAMYYDNCEESQSDSSFDELFDELQSRFSGDKVDDDVIDEVIDDVMTRHDTPSPEISETIIKQDVKILPDDVIDDVIDDDVIVSRHDISSPEPTYELFQLVSWEEVWTCLANQNLDTSSSATSSPSPDPLFNKYLKESLILEANAIINLSKSKLETSKLPIHWRLLASVYMIITETETPPRRFGSHFETIGFQGSDPATDLRGVGIFGLLQLLFLTQKHAKLTNALYQLSIDNEQHFPFAIVCINFSKLALECLLSNSKDLFKLCNKRNSVIQVINDLYASAICEFYFNWLEGGCTVIEFSNILANISNSIKKHPEAAVTQLFKSKMSKINKF